MRRTLLTIAAILFLHTVAVADPVCYSNCFEIVAGQYPTLVFTENRDVQIKIEQYHGDYWTVSDATSSGTMLLALGTVGTRVTSGLFGSGSGNHVSRDFSPREEAIFRFAFFWESEQESGQRVRYWGWVSLVENAAMQPVVFGCEVSPTSGWPIVGRGEPEHIYAEVTFRTIDHGDWLELDVGCIPMNTERWVLIPSEINGKPIKSIGYLAFDGCSKITGITIPDGILNIGDYAFSGCTSIKELIIPSSVTNVGHTALNSCDSLNDLRIDAVLPGFGYKACAHSGVTNIVLALGITNINNFAFADSPRLESVTIPQSVQRVCTWSFDENCKALKTAYVPYATVLEDEAFPPGCTIIRYGPTLDIYTPRALQTADEETKIAFMRTLDWRDYASAPLLCFTGWHGDGGVTEDHEPITAANACAHLGISPRHIETTNDEGRKEVYYKMPSVVMTGFDPATRTITGRVVPAAGTRIVSEPLKRAFGFRHYVTYPEDCVGLVGGKDWGPWINAGDQGFELDLSDYLTDGTFRITYSEYVPEDKYGNFFKILLHDNAEQLW